MVTYSYPKLIQRIDELVSKHDINQAKQEFSSVNWDKLPRELCASAAALARRLDNPKAALKILHNNIYGTEAPSPKDMIEYCSSLRTLGLINQALTLLNRLEVSADVHLHKAFCFISRWDYSSALKELNSYRQTPGLSDKQILLSDVNRLTCLIECGKFKESWVLIEKLEKEAQSISHHLYINILELKGQYFIKNDQAKEAIETLNKALEVSQSQNHTTDLFVKKWWLIARCLNKELAHDSDEVTNFRKEIRDMADWETLRDFDWHMALISEDSELMEYVYFGTPFEGFRSTMLSQNAELLNIKSYLWKNTNDEIVPFDLMLEDQKSRPFGLALHRLWMILASDFYRPWSVARIFNSLYADEVYHPISSPKRVYRLIDKLTKVIEDEKAPVNLESTVYGYRLRLKNNGTFRLYPRMQFEDQYDFYRYLLEINGLEQNFNVRDVQKNIPMSEYRWYRALKKMEEIGYITKTKQGYSLVSNRKAA